MTTITMRFGMVMIFIPCCITAQPEQKAFPVWNFAPVQELAQQTQLPDPFLKPDGSRVSTPDEWPQQRAYLKAMLEHYQYGTMPPKPEHLEVQCLDSKTLLDGKALQERYEIRLNRNQRSMSFQFELIRPRDAKRLPAVIKNCYTFFDDEGRGKVTADHDKAAAIKAASKGYLLCKFNRNQVADDRPNNRETGVFPLYPESDWGTIAAWAWAHGVVADALNQLELIDMKHVVATGHSRGGKAALCAGIYDDRIAITAPNSSGTGGTGSLRYFEDGQKPQRISYHRTKFPHWWVGRFYEFEDNEARLPFDAHTAKVLVAPRALFNAHAQQDYWANPYGTELTFRAADRVFEWLGARDQQGICWRDGGHAQSDEDWSALMEFTEWKFRGIKSQRNFKNLSYPKAVLPLNWTTPQSH